MTKIEFYAILFFNGALRKYLKNFKKHNTNSRSLSEFLNWFSPCRWVEYAFNWGATSEDRKYWQNIDNQMIEYRNQKC